MPEDILAELRIKEEEMEALINDARKRAAVIRELGLKSARELKESILKETDEEIKAQYSSVIEEISAEARRIEETGEKEALELKEKGLKRKDAVAREVMRFLLDEAGERR